MVKVYNEIFLKTKAVLPKSSQTFSTSENVFINYNRSSATLVEEQETKSLSNMKFASSELGEGDVLGQTGDNDDKNETFRLNPNLSVKSSLPIMDQDEFIKFWGLINCLIIDIPNEDEIQDASISISTNLFKLGELARKLQASNDMSEKEGSQIAWCITFEQIIASILNDNLFNEYFDINYDLNEKLFEYKSQHA